MGVKDAQYGELFDTLLRYSGDNWKETLVLLEHIRSQLRPRPAPSAPSRALDVGAGSGNGAAWLVEALPEATVTAVEPNPLCTQRLQERFEGQARAIIVEATIEQWLRESADAGFDIIVMLAALYHIPRDTWDAVITQLIDRLHPSGIAVVSMKDPASGCNRMIRHFGGQPLDIVAFFEAYRPSGWHIVRLVRPNILQTESLDDLERILRFMLADVKLKEPIPPRGSGGMRRKISIEATGAGASTSRSTWLC